MTAAEIVAALACGRSGCPCGKRGVTHCPAHADEHPSLNVKDVDGGKVLVKCFTGCAQEAIIDALKARNLWRRYDNGARPRQRKATEVRYESRDAAGNLVAVHVRLDKGGDKAMWWELPDGTRGLNGRRVESLPLYGSEHLADLPDCAAIVVTEGEKAAAALNGRGVLAVGTVTGAAATPGRDALALLLPHYVLLWPDADAAGREHMGRIAERLTSLGHRAVRIVHWPDAPEKGDAADFAGSDDELRALLAAARPYEPPPAVDLAALLDDVKIFIRRYVVLSDAQADAVALWVGHSYAFDAAESTPYLSVTSAEKRSGKTRLLEALSCVVARPWLTGRVTAAVLVRKTAKVRPTLLLDESDTAFKAEKEYAEALRGVLNAGHRRGGVTSLCLNKGEDFADFAVFGPKAIAGIGKLPDTVADRAIAIVLKRKAPAEKAARFKWRQAQQEAAPLRERLERWAAADVDALGDAEPTIPDALDDRAADGWEPLLAIADAAGGDWPERARRAALSLSVGDGREDDSLGVRLLRDIRAVFDERGADRLPSGELVTALGAIEEAPWGDLKGKPMDARTLARLLRRYDVRPRTIRLSDDSTSKGYHADWFSDAWQRYLPSLSPEKPSQAPQASQTPDTDTADVTDVAVVTANSGVSEQEECTICGNAEIGGYTSDGEPRCAGHFLQPSDGPLVRFAVETLALPIVARPEGG